jgi:DNA-binding LacI/PurR family transcriptional regulator
LGHKTVGAILGPEDATNARERERGFREELSEHGLVLPPSRVLHGAFSAESGRANALALLSRSGRPSALFCADDVLALGAINAAHSLGLRVPDDVTIIGFDDIGMASWDLFSLTTIRYDLDRMAVESVRMLIARIDDPERPPEQLVLPADLVLRSSHGPPNRSKRVRSADHYASRT